MGGWGVEAATDSLSPHVVNYLLNMRLQGFEGIQAWPHGDYILEEKAGKKLGLYQLFITIF